MLQLIRRSDPAFRAPALSKLDRLSRQSRLREIGAT